MPTVSNRLPFAIARSSGHAVGAAALACLAAYWLAPAGPSRPPTQTLSPPLHAATPAVRPTLAMNDAVTFDAAAVDTSLPAAPLAVADPLAVAGPDEAAAVGADDIQTERLAALSPAIAGYPVIKRMVDSAMADGVMDNDEHADITHRLSRIKRNQADRNKRRSRAHRG